MKPTKKQIMNDKIYRHGEELKRFFNLDASVDPVKLSKQLFSIENKLHNAMECLCNTNTLHHHEQPKNGLLWEEATEKEQDEFFEKMRNKISRILGKDAMDKIKFNHDPRGYSIKIKEEYSKDFYYRDWGGYGIIAPDFKEEV